jgi:hypothetical protein
MSKATDYLWEIENAQPEDKSVAIEQAYKKAVKIDYDIDCDCCPWLYFDDGSILRVDEEEGFFNEIDRG